MVGASGAWLDVIDNAPDGSKVRAHRLRHRCGFFRPEAIRIGTGIANMARVFRPGPGRRRRDDAGDSLVPLRHGARRQGGCRPGSGQPPDQRALLATLGAAALVVAAGAAAAERAATAAARARLRRLLAVRNCPIGNPIMSEKTAAPGRLPAAAINRSLHGHGSRAVTSAIVAPPHTRNIATAATAITAVADQPKKRRAGEAV